MAVFRDDAYMAAWRDDGWSGPRAAVSTALFNQQEPLSYSQLREATSRLDDKDFNSAFAALHSGGEISRSPDDFYRLTKAGRAARQTIEATTDRNYLVLFNALDAGELKELIDLLDRLRGPIAP